MSVDFDTKTAERQADVEDLFGFEDRQLPAAGPGSALFAGYATMAQGFERGTASELVRRAEQIGALMGDDGFYLWEVKNRDGTTGEVFGISVDLAKALANHWGACAYGVELDHVEGDRVFLTGVCVDFAQVVPTQRPYIFTIPPAPGRFGGSIVQRNRWEAQMLQSAISKALRGAILDCLPPWYTNPALHAARKAWVAAEAAGAKASPVELRRNKAIEWFSEIGVSEQDLVDLVDTPLEMWGEEVLLKLKATFAAIRAGNTSTAAVFGDIWAERKRAAAAADGGGDLAGLGLKGKADTGGAGGGNEPPPASDPPPTDAGGAPAAPASDPEPTPTPEPPKRIRRSAALYARVVRGVRSLGLTRAFDIANAALGFGFNVADGPEDKLSERLVEALKHGGSRGTGWTGQELTTYAEALEVAIADLEAEAKAAEGSHAAQDDAQDEEELPPEPEGVSEGEASQDPVQAPSEDPEPVTLRSQIAELEDELGEPRTAKLRRFYGIADLATLEERQLRTYRNELTRAADAASSDR